jgi:hypothetical protein
MDIWSKDRTMYQSVLGMELDDARPEARYFLTRFLQVYGPDEGIHADDRTLAQELGLPEYEVSTATAYLEKRGLLTIKRRVDDKGWRYNIYECKPVPELTSKELPVRHEAILEEILKPDTEQTLNARRHPISLTDRWLMAVLLAHADLGGAVRTLSIPRLSALTGIRERRLLIKLEALKRKEYIRSTVPDIKHHKIFGHSNGAIFLNLRHAAFRDCVNPGATLVYSPRDKTSYVEATEAHRIIELAKLIEEAQETNQRATIKKLTENMKTAVDVLPPLESLEYIHEHFCQDTGSQAEEYLQMKLEEYASHLLSKYWQLLSNPMPQNGNDPDRKALQDKVLSVKIAHDIGVLAPALINQPIRYIGEDHQLEDFIYEVALHISRKVCHLMKRFEKIEFPAMDHLILPQSMHGKEKRAVALVSTFPYKDKEDIGCIVFQEEAGSFIQKVTIDHGAESSINRPLQYANGLLTDTRKKVMAI